MASETMTETEAFQRPPAEDIETAWQSVFSDPLISLSRLKATALSKEGLGGAGIDGGVLLRSVYWRFYHNLLPPPTSLDLFAPALQSSRASYDALRRRYLVAPDGRWAADCSGYDEYTAGSASTTAGAGPSRPSSSSTSAPAAAPEGDSWDPLSLSGSNPWKTWFAHVDLRTTIHQDVERTFPDIPYFQLPRVRRCLTTSLFLFAVLNPDVGYRQGMHELLACCFLAVDRDSLDIANIHIGGKGDGKRNGEAGQSAMRDTLDRRSVEHDAFELFCAIMKSAKAFYEWRAEETGPRTRTPSALQAPIIVRCNNLHNSLVRRIDPQLWERFETEGVEAQIWAIRWIRLIFTRELPFALAMRIWDGVFAEDPGLGLLDFVCVTMLLLIRNELINADYPSLLTSLLHYPSPSLTYPFEPFLILSQALFLRNSISPASGVEVVIQNQDLLGIRANPPEPDEEPVHRLHEARVRGRGGALSPSSAIRRSQTPKGVGGLAQGLFERAQAAGLDKAIMSTVADFRRNLPDSATAYSYLPNLPFSPIGSPGQRDGSFSTIPNNISALPTRSAYPAVPPVPPVPSFRPEMQSRPSIDSQSSEKTVKDAEREVAELRLAMVGMGKAMTEWLATLHPAPDQSGTPANNEVAWRGLDRVKETLLDAAGKEVEEIVREWAWHDGLEAPRSRATTPAMEVEAAHETIDEGGDRAALSAIQIAQEITVNPSLDIQPSDERTPTAPQVDVFPATPSYPTSSYTGSTPLSAPSTGFTNEPDNASAILRSSTRESPPVTSLPRAPMSAPIQSSFPRSTPFASTSRALPRDVQKGKERGTPKNEMGREAEADPLAGLGVSVRQTNTNGLSGRDDRAKNGSGSSGVDPLLGLGVR